MKLVVYGTSNSLMTLGWVNAIRPKAVDAGCEMDNRSLGGASSRYAAYLTCTSQKCGKRDRVILDFCINDQMFLDQGSITLEDVLGHYTTILSEMEKRKELHKLLVLLFPQERFIHSSSCALIDSLILLLTEVGVDFIDFREKIGNWIVERGETTKDAFPDPRHFAPPYQELIGASVLAYVSTQAPSVSGTVICIRRVLRGLPSAGYRRLDITTPVPPTKVSVGTSLLRRDVYSFRKGECFRATGANYLVGALIWCHSNAGAFVFSGADAAIRLPLRRNLKNLFLFDTFSQPLRISPTMDVEAGNDISVPFQKALGLTVATYDDSESTSEVVELIGCDIPPVEYWRSFSGERKVGKAESSSPLSQLRKLLHRLGTAFRNSIE